MVTQNDLEYYRRREAQCKQLADNARDPGIQKMHRKMAKIYAVKTAALEQKERVRA